MQDAGQIFHPVIITNLVRTLQKRSASNPTGFFRPFDSPPSKLAKLNANAESGIGSSPASSLYEHDVVKSDIYFREFHMGGAGVDHDINRGGLTVLSQSGVPKYSSPFNELSTPGKKPLIYLIIIKYLSVMHI